MRLRRAALIAAAATGLGSGLTGCASVNPVNWWHQQEGGRIAQQRPEPPGANQAYPNLATVPGKPTAPSEQELKALTSSLIADRTNAQHAAEAEPLADPSSPSASPGLFGVGTAAPPLPAGSGKAAANAATSAAAGGTNVASASMPAVTAPPVPASPSPAAPAPPARSAAASAPEAPTAAPRGAVQSTPLARADQAPLATVPAAPAASPVAPPVASPAAAPQPDIPEAPPPRPAVAGAPPPPPPVATPMPAMAGKSAEIVFGQDSAQLNPAASDEVKAFAAQRGNAVVGVTGYGDASASDPGAQAAALNLGLARAQSIVDVLKTAGVPGVAIRVSAEASGRGASLHLLQ